VPELAILVGLQGSGKTTFFLGRLAATHAHVSRDLFRNARSPRRRLHQLVEAALAEERSVAVDNTSPTRAERAELLRIARAHGARSTCYFFVPDLEASIARNARREGAARIPVVGILATRKRLEEPALDEGFDRLFEVRTLAGDFEVTERRAAASLPAGGTPP
jgi:predicted kinase